jgi:RNA polymerase sigma factor (sigma-70 family)
MSPSLERDLVLRAAARDAHARAELVEAFLPLIGSVARMYRGSASIERAELMQEGVVGLLRALERYDPELGTPFWAYASWWVRQAMQHLVAQLGGPVVLSDRARRHLARLKEANRGLTQRHRHEPSTSELALETGFSRRHVESLLTGDRTPMSLEEPRRAAGDFVGTVGEQVADPRAEDELERATGRLDTEALRGVLGERERTIVRSRFGLGGRPHTLAELGERLSLSAERVRQIEEKALEKLRCAAV